VLHTTFSDDFGTGHYFQEGPASATVIVYEDGTAQITRVDVGEGFQRQGLGRKMFQVIETEFPEVETWILKAETDDARKFWDKMGFKEGGELEAGKGETAMIK